MEAKATVDAGVEPFEIVLPGRTEHQPCEAHIVIRQGMRRDARATSEAAMTVGAEPQRIARVVEQTAVALALEPLFADNVMRLEDSGLPTGRADALELRLGVKALRITDRDRHGHCRDRRRTGAAEARRRDRPRPRRPMAQL